VLQLKYLSLHYNAALFVRETTEGSIEDKKQDPLCRPVKAKHETGWETQANKLNSHLRVKYPPLHRSDNEFVGG
jgi:hypothetical protein